MSYYVIDVIMTLRDVDGWLVRGVPQKRGCASWTFFAGASCLWWYICIIKSICGLLKCVISLVKVLVVVCRHLILLTVQVRPPLYSFDLTQPLSRLGSSVVRASA